MRILAGADFHGYLGIVGWFVEKGRSREVEAIVLAGDQLGYSDEVEDPEEDQTLNARRVEAMLLEVGVPVLYIMGNDHLIELATLEHEVLTD